MSAKPEVDPLADAITAELQAKFSILSPEEIEAARAKARSKFEAQGKAKATNELIDAELARLQVMTGDRYADEKIWINIDLPPFADRLTIDGRAYSHGHVYFLPRHMVESMREQISRMWDHEAEIKGESIRNKIAQYRDRNFDRVPGRNVSGKAA